MIFDRRRFLGVLLASAASPALANAPLTSIRPIPRDGDFGLRAAKPAEALLADAQLSGKVAFAVADVRSGEILEAHNPVLALPPASVTKSITALYALDRLGEGFRFRTRLVATGPVSNGRLRGDLILVGGGDPTLDTDALGEMARQLKARGVREVTGDFKVYGGVLPTIPEIDPEQPPHVGYNPAVSGLNLNYNRVHFQWKQESGGYSLTMDARARKFRPQVAIARMRVVDRSVPVYTYSDAGGTDEWTVARRALGRAGSRWLPVRKPELYAAEVFQTLARSHGIVLPRAQVENTRPGGDVLVEHTSQPLVEILRDMLKWSTNLTAEVVGLSATAADGRGARTLRASATEMSTWLARKYGARKAKLVDHSGLGGNSRLTASDMVKVLAAAHASTALRPILKKVPLRNDKGEPIANHPIKVHAKTGTLNFVSALAGYMNGPGGRELAFAIFTADVPRRNAISAADGDIPKGTRAWRARSRWLQQGLIERWGLAYSS